MRTIGRVIGLALFLSVVVWVCPVARAADTAKAGAGLAVLKVVPEDAWSVVVVSRLDKADEAIDRLSQETQAPPPQLLKMFKTMAGIQEGLDEQGSAAFALMPSEEANHDPITVAFIPVTDYKKFITQLQPEDASAEITKINLMGKSSLAGAKEGFAVVVHESDKDLLKKVLDSSRPVAPIIGSLSGWLGEHSLSWVATPTGVKQGTAAARKALAEARAALAKTNDQMMKMSAANLEVYETFLSVAEKEVNQIGVGVRLDDDGGWHLDTRTLFTPDGSWAAAAKALERHEGSRLACLPGGPFMMAFEGAMPKSFSKSMMNMSVEMMYNMSKVSGGKELTEDEAKRLNEMMEKAMTDVRSMSMVIGQPKPGTSLYANTVGVMKVKNAEKYMADYQKMVASMSDLFKGIGMDIQQTKKLKIDDIDGIELTMDMSKMFAKMPNNPGTKPMMQMLFGPEGKLSVYIAPIDDTTIAMSYVNPENIARVKAACKNPQSSLAADADIAETAKLLPDGAQWVGYVSPKGLVDFATAIMAGFAGPGGAMPALPPFPQTPPIGISAEVSEKGLDLDIVIPGPALKGMGAYMKQIQKTFAPPAT